MLLAPEKNAEGQWVFVKNQTLPDPKNLKTISFRKVREKLQVHTLNPNYEKVYTLDANRTAGMFESALYGLSKSEEMVANITSFWHGTPEETALVVKQLNYKRGYRQKFARFSILEAGLKARLPYCASRVCQDVLNELLPTGAAPCQFDKTEKIYVPW